MLGSRRESLVEVGSDGVGKGVPSWELEPSEVYHEGPYVFVCSSRFLVGLVVKASASRAEDTGFESRLRRDFFFVVESYQ